VFVKMGSTVTMKVQMIVMFVTDHPVNGPHKVNKSESRKKIRDYASPQSFDKIKVRQSYSKSDANQTNNDRASHMTKPAQNSKPAGFCKRPVPGPGNDDKGQVMIRSGQCMDDSQGNGGQQKKEQFTGHSDTV
jgi:hypothetical protein